MSRLRCTAAAVLLPIAAATAVACGHKGNPVPPERPSPPPVTTFTIERTAVEVTLRFAVPDPQGPQDDDHAPRLFERVEVYAMTKGATEPAATPIELATPAHQLAAVNAPLRVKSTAEQPAPAADASAELMFRDTPAAPVDGAATARYYVVQAVNGKRRGPLSPVLKVPLGAIPAAPAGVTAKYDEHTLSVSWAPAPAGQRFVVDETDASGVHPSRLTAEPLETPAFEAPVEFGKPRCFVVRAVQKAFDVTIVGEAAAPACITPVDRFPPEAPTDLVASAGDAAVQLSWTASAATDLAGYVVLRAEGANGTLQPLTPQPIAATAYSDATARAGVTYLYAVKAVDRAGNESGLSNRYTVTAR